MTGPFAWRHVTIGPCALCGSQTTRYGPLGRRHCDDCLPVGEWLAEHGLTQLPPETGSGADQDHHREPVHIAEVIQAFRDQPETFIAGAFPSLPRRPDMAPVNVGLLGNPEDIPPAAAMIIAAAAGHGWTASELSRPYPNQGGPGVRVSSGLTEEEPE